MPEDRFKSQEEKSHCSFGLHQQRFDARLQEVIVRHYVALVRP